MQPLTPTRRSRRSVALGFTFYKMLPRSRPARSGSGRSTTRVRGAGEAGEPAADARKSVRYTNPRQPIQQPCGWCRAAAAGWVESLKRTTAGFRDALHPTDGGTDADAEDTGSASTRPAGFHAPHHALTQITGIGGWHWILSAESSTEIRTQGRFTRSPVARGEETSQTDRKTL